MALYKGINSTRNGKYVGTRDFLKNYVNLFKKEGIIEANLTTMFCGVYTTCRGKIRNKRLEREWKYVIIFLLNYLN